MTLQRKTAPWRERARIVSRVLAAVFGGYAIAAASTAALALHLPLVRVDAVIAATLSSFIFYAFAVMWAFAARTAIRAWLGLLVPAALLAACALPGVSS